MDSWTVDITAEMWAPPQAVATIDELAGLVENRPRIESEYDLHPDFVRDHRSHF